jgi:methionyl-tRNA formyltransferase
MPAIEVAAVVTRADAPTGRHQEVESTPIKKMAEKNNLRILTPVKHGSPDFLSELKNLAPETAVVAAYGRIIPKAALDLPLRGTLNLHPSLLPVYRGPSPIQAAILNGDKKTGVTLMLLDEEMDHGPVLAQCEVELDGTEIYSELEQKLSIIAAEFLSENLLNYLDGKIEPREQDDARAVYCAMIERASGRIDWRKSAVEIERMSRAYEKWPGVWAVWAGSDSRKLRLKFSDVSVEPECNLKPGEITVQSDALVIGAAQGAIRVRKIQAEGKKEMMIKEFLNGFSRFANGRFE